MTLKHKKKIKMFPSSSPFSIACGTFLHAGKACFDLTGGPPPALTHGANIAVKPSPLTTPEEILLVGEGERLGHVHGKESWKV